MIAKGAPYVTNQITWNVVIKSLYNISCRAYTGLKVELSFVIS